MSEIWDSILSDAQLDETTFPLARRGISGGRDFGRIKPPHQPGQRVTDTGRQPLVFKLEIPLFEGIEGRTDLYPTVYEELLDIFTNDDRKAEVEYIDPVLGAFQVKVVSFDVNENSGARDGAVITCTLEEINTDALGIVVPPRSPGREAVAAAAALDTELEELGVDQETVDAALDGSGYPLTDDEQLAIEESDGATFEALCSDFQEGLTIGTLYAEQIAARVDAVRARVKAVTELDVVRSARGALAYSAALRLIESLGAQADRAVVRAVASVRYEVRGAVSVYDLAVQLYGDAARADEIVRRNALTNPWAIPVGTVLTLAER